MDKTNLFAIIVAFLLVVLIIWAIYKQVNEHYLQDDPTLHRLQDKLKPLLKSDKPFTGYLEPLNSRDILGEVNLYKGEKSYTINKQKVFICLRDEEGEYYSDNMLLYVIIHELAHVICDEIGHTEKFHKIFQELLERAAEMSIYNPSIPIVTNYCEHGNEV